MIDHFKMNGIPTAKSIGHGPKEKKLLSSEWSQAMEASKRNKLKNVLTV